MIQYYYTKKEWGVVMEKEELKILEELRRILNSKNEAIVILNNYFRKLQVQVGHLHGRT